MKKLYLEIDDKFPNFETAIRQCCIGALDIQINKKSNRERIAARIRENSPICANLIPTIKEILMGVRKRMQERNVKNILNKITLATSAMQNKTESKNTPTCKSIPTEIKNILLK